MSNKQCKTCGEVKHEDDFGWRHEKGKKKRRNVCLVCYNARRPHVTPKPKDVTLDHKKAENDNVTRMLNISQWEPERVELVQYEKFIKRFDLDIAEEDFNALKESAQERLRLMGYYNPKHRILPVDQRYIVIGDTFGTHTTDGMFDMLEIIIREEMIDAVVLIGHNIDEENEISNRFLKINIPIHVIPVKDELKEITEFSEEYGFVVTQDFINIGDVIIRNQEYITPYAKTAISALDPVIYKGNHIVNCTRHEYFTRTTAISPSFVASPGALATPHVATTINKLILQNGGRMNVKPTNKNSYHKHRKNEDDKLLWEHGWILIDENNDISMRRIVELDGGYKTVVGGGIMTSKGWPRITEVIGIAADTHAPYHAQEIYQAAEAFVAHEVDHIYLNGDILDCRSFNPHNQFQAAKDDVLQELDGLEEVLKTFHGIAPLSIVYGNHEDFMRRFAERYPQFYPLFKQALEKTYQKYGTLVASNPDHWAQIGANAIIHHGSGDMFGVSGSNLEKSARVFGELCIIGHTHSAAIRFGVYRTGCLCQMDQGYNNAYASNWNYGCAILYTDGETDFVVPINFK